MTSPNKLDPIPHPPKKPVVGNMLSIDPAAPADETIAIESARRSLEQEWQRLRDKAQAMAVHAHELMGCRGFSRSDMIFAGGELYWLEVNTIPGMTETSLLPMAAAKAGMDYDTLTERILESALRRAKGVRV